MISNELLKKKILDEAIHGRLVKNDLSLKSIYVQSIETTTPFEIPNNWKWAKFSDVSDFNVGKTPPTKDLTYWGDEIDWISISDMHHRKTIESTKRRLSNKSLKNIFNNKLVPSGTLLMSFKLTIGRLAITGKECVHNEAIISIYPKQYLLRDYLMNALDALDLEENVKSAIKGKTLNSKSLANILIPIPPIEEQNKIVKKIEELFELIERKEKNDKEIEKLKTLLKEKILDSALHGNLVENDLSLPVVDIEETKNNIPFEIPKNWKWTNIFNVFTTNSGVFLTEKEKRKHGEYPVYGGNGIISNYNSYNVEKDTLVIGRVGYYCGNVRLTTTKSWINDNALIVKMKIKDYYPKYMLYILNFSDLKNKNSATAQPVVSYSKIKNILIPIPPLEQQKKIVDKIERCFELIEQL